MDCELPDDFELIVIGTGMIESIIAAAASRIGKKVLHIDKNDFYGGMWASFNLEGMDKYIIKPQVSSSSNVNVDNSELIKLLKNGQHLLNIGNTLFGIDNVVHNWHIPECEKPSPENDVTICEPNLEPPEPAPKRPTQQSVTKESRRFNLDLTPKLQFARGDFVELLISSNIARYSEYRSVSRVLTWLNGQLEIVPCSRSDVFSNTRVTVVEKRMLMKLLTTCLDDDSSHFDEYKTKTFYQYLKDKKLTNNLIHYVLYAISMSDKSTPCLEGVSNTKRFLNSLGKFGKTPFLFSMYGSGELPQAFCRLCAVFGGTYCLNRKVDSLVINEDNKCSGIICGKQLIHADNIVMGIENIPEMYATKWTKQKISRAIFITDRSILPSEKENLTLLLFPPEGNKHPIIVIELGPATGTCPQNYRTDITLRLKCIKVMRIILDVVHMYCKQVSSPEEDLKHCVESLFNSDTLTNILWSLYLTIVDVDDCTMTDGMPGNIHACAGPDLDLDYDESVKQAKNIFMKMYPEAEFLPRAPDPEEIILCDDEESKETEETIETNETKEAKESKETKEDKKESEVSNE